VYGCQEADNDPTGTVETKQMLTYYELDLGLNHVVRKYSEGLEDRANFLINGMTHGHVVIQLQRSCRCHYFGGHVLSYLLTFLTELICRAPIFLW